MVVDDNRKKLEKPPGELKSPDGKPRGFASCGKKKIEMTPESELGIEKA